MPDFYYFHGDFGTQKMLMCFLFFEREGGGLRKSMVCTLMKMLTFVDGPLVLLTHTFYLSTTENNTRCRHDYAKESLIDNNNNNNKRSLEMKVIFSWEGDKYS